MRLIDADMLCKYCNNNINHSITPNEIMRMPFIDAEPVKHAYWEEKQDMSGDTYYHCTNCKEDFVFVEGTPKDNLYYYCPNCGAKMDGESE